MGRQDTDRYTRWSRRTPRSRRSAALYTLALLALVAGLLFTGSAPAAISDDNAQPSWSFALDGPAGGNDNALDVVVTSKATWVAGQVSTAAAGLDASLARIPRDSPLTPLVNTWNGANSGNDAAYALAVKGSYVYTAGASRNAAGDLDLLVNRWRADGTAWWGKRFNGAGKKDDVATDVGIDGKGNVIVCGTTQGALYDDWVVRKYSPKGTKLWSWTYAGPAGGGDEPTELLVDATGNVYVTGTTTVAELLTAAYTVKLSPAGKKLWAKRYTGPNNRITDGAAITRCPSGGVYVGGSTHVQGSNFDMFVLRYSPTGGRKVFDLFNPSAGDVVQRLSDLVVASSGIVVGVGAQGVAPTRDAMYIEWTPDGMLRAFAARGTTGDDVWTAVAADGFAGSCMTGQWEDATGARTERVSTRPYASRWVYQFDSGDATSVTANAIAANGTYVAVVGRYVASGSDYDQLVHIWSY